MTTGTRFAHGNAVMVFDVLKRALAFIERTGVETYDPNDLKGIPLLLWTYRKRTPLRRVVRIAVCGLSFLAPIATRRALGVGRTCPAGGIAQFASAYCELHRLNSDPILLRRVELHLRWLQANSAPASVGKGWGLPFPWQSTVLVPANTPIGHTTMQVGNALLSYYERTGAEWALEEAGQACAFLAGGLGRREEKEGAASVSYTPLDSSRCINTNAENGALLIEVGRLTNHPEWIDLGKRLVRFVCLNQNSDGSWNYFAERPDSVIDGYHTGMVLGALHRVANELPSEDRDRGRALHALDNGLPFYLRQLITPYGCPKNTVDKLAPLDAYAFAQAVLTLSEFGRDTRVRGDLRQASLLGADRIVEHCVPLLADAHGSFAYRRYGGWNIRLGSLRWAQAIVCWALASYLRALREVSHP